MRERLHEPRYHKTLIGLVIFDLVIIFIDLIISMLNLSCYTDKQLEQFKEEGIPHIAEPDTCLLHHSPSVVAGEWFLWGMSILLLSIFLIDILVALFAFGPRRFKKPIFAIDAVVIVASLIMELIFKLSPNIYDAKSTPAAMVLLRLWKVIRAIHAVAHSIELKNQSIIRKIKEAKMRVEEEHRIASQKIRQLEIKNEWLWARITSPSPLPEEEKKSLLKEEMESYINRVLETEQQQQQDRLLETRNNSVEITR